MPGYTRGCGDSCVACVLVWQPNRFIIAMGWHRNSNRSLLLVPLVTNSTGSLLPFAALPVSLYGKHLNT